MTSRQLKASRQAAARHQQGRCFYCDQAMWDGQRETLQVFSEQYGLTPNQAWQRRCTAEHLQPASLGGAASGANIVAACLCCNSRRHRRRAVPEPTEYRAYVRARVAAGRWR